MIADLRRDQVCTVTGKRTVSHTPLSSRRPRSGGAHSRPDGQRLVGQSFCRHIGSHIVKAIGLYSGSQSRLETCPAAIREQGLVRDQGQAVVIGRVVVDETGGTLYYGHGFGVDQTARSRGSL